MRRARFDNLKKVALCDAQQNGGLRDCQHRLTAFRTDGFSARRGLPDDVSPIGCNRHFKFSLDFHLLLPLEYRGTETKLLPKGFICLDFFWIFFGYFLDCGRISLITGNLKETKTIRRFGAFRLDANERRLWCESEPVSLTPKQFDLLFYFVENAGRTAKKSELLDAVWADIYIEETTLARNVSWLRQKLAEYASGESFIETVPKLGYRFTAKVRHSDEDTLIIEEQIVQHIRGEETITIDDTFAQERGEKKLSKSPLLLFSSSPILLVALALVALGGIAAFFYLNNTKTDANAKIKTENIEIDATREVVDSRINIQRGDLITFSVAGEFNYADNQIRTFEGDKNADVSKDYIFEKAAPWSLVGWIGTETDQSRYFQVSKIHSITADRNGSLYFAVNEPKNKFTAKSGSLVTTVNLQRNALNERPQIKIGSVVHLQNRFPPNVGGYLDAWGAVWSKSEFAKITTQTMFVSTHYNPNRDNGSGSWEIVSATGKTNGEPLVVGDRIHLRNMFPDAGYLDSCGWVEHLPIFKEFKDQTSAISTTKSPNRDYGTGTWIIRSANESDGSPVLEGDGIALENGFLVVLNGKIYKVGFLNVAGNVKDIPSFNDYDGASLVFSQDRPSDQSILDVWTISISKYEVRSEE